MLNTLNKKLLKQLNDEVSGLEILVSSARIRKSKELPQNQEPREGGFRRGLLQKKFASLGCGALSAKCTAGLNTTGYFFVSLGVTLDSAETPFAKTLFSWFLTKVSRYYPPLGK